MKERYFKNLLLTLLLLTGQAAWADGVNHTAFRETFNSTEGTGGHDGGATNDEYTALHCDTLYIVKAATITDKVTINDQEVDGIYADRCVGNASHKHELIVPKYFYMALLHYNKETDTYHSIAFWTDHIDETQSVKNLADYAISIKELEKRTGIDFFCNLPDVIEEDVEAQEPDLEFWKKITRSGE